MNIARTALEFLSLGGKRLRPRLFRAVRAAFGEDTIPEIEDAIECFHKASLIHDDIQDNAQTRYGRPCIHRTCGVAAAIACGDILVARGYKALSALDLPCAAEIVATAAECHEKLCLGQAEELSRPEALSLQSVLGIYRKKTGEGFALAAALGAISCGCGPRIADAAKTYGREWGLAYQIADDLADGEGMLLACVSRGEAEALKQKALSRAADAISGLFELKDWFK